MQKITIVLVAGFILLCHFYSFSTGVNGRAIASSNQNNYLPTDTSGSKFVKGADVSWLPEMEASGYKFFNNKGLAEDCFKILKNHGINTIRLRTFVNPSKDPINGHCSTPETVAMALRAKNWGMRVLIDIHYSDSWADPSKQVKPAAWAAHDFSRLLRDVSEYTTSVMVALKNAGVTPEWVQVGNEIPTGMIYPEGNTSNWAGLSQLINSGYDAVKKVSPVTKVILHIDQGNNTARLSSWFDHAVANKTRFDVVGLSYYPYWLPGNPDYTLSIKDLAVSMNLMYTKYKKEVMVVEVGGEDFKTDNTFEMLKAVSKMVRSVPDHKGLGLIYWEPEGAASWSHYGLSAWGKDGKPTKALEAFKD